MFYSTWTKRIFKDLTSNNFKFNYQRTLLPTLNHRSSKEKKNQLSKTVNSFFQLEIIKNKHDQVSIRILYPAIYSNTSFTSL